VVGPVFFEAPVTKSKQIHSSEQSPDPELDRVLLPILIEEVEIKAQRFLAHELSRQEGLAVVPFDDTRRILADIAPSHTELSEDQMLQLARYTGSDYVITGLIHDYGAVRWQYWVTGWFLHASAATTAIGLATAWNPAAIGAYLAVDTTTDLPIWYGGAQIFGWAFRPVRVHLNAFQNTSCAGIVWSDDELQIRVPGKTLAQYPSEQQRLKQVQLEANLKHAIEEVAEHAAAMLRLQECEADGRPKHIR
jgi:hypothetical protein